MANFNRVIMMGNLTRDPELKQLASGQTVCRLGLASNRQFKNRQTGMMVQEVCFVDVDVWGPQADSCGQYLAKGRGVLIEGRLKLDTWVDNDGQRRSKHSIVADRVTFLPNAATTDVDFAFGTADSNRSAVTEPPSAPATEPTAAASAEQDSPVAQEAPGAQDAPASSDAPVDNSSGEVDFKTDAPFEDDLPF